MDTKLVTFDGREVACVQAAGVAAFTVADVATLLGYQDQRYLVDMIARDWKDDFVDGADMFRVTGPELAALKSAGLVGKNAPSALLLTESGVNLAAILSRRPESTRLRQWLAREVMPQIRKQGGYGVDRAAILAEVHDRGHLTDGALVAELSDAEMAKLDPAKLVGLVRKLAARPGAKPAEPAPVKRMSAVHAARSVLASALEQRERLATGPKGDKGIDWIGRFDTDGDGWSWVALRTDFVDRHLKAMGLAPMKVRTRWRDDGLTSPRAGKPSAVTTPTTLPGCAVPEETIRFDRATVDRLLNRADGINASIAFLGAANGGADADVLEDAAEWVEHQSGLVGCA